MIILLFLSLIIWVYLLGFRGFFWLSNQRISININNEINWPNIAVVIPARNEAQQLPITLKSILLQDYPIPLQIILVDDQSDDGTAEVALTIANNITTIHQLHVIKTTALPSGWSGKLWALSSGLDQATKLIPPPDYFWLTDADIEHNLSNLRQLVAQAITFDLSLVSLMVKLRCVSFWEWLLIPAFVFFFEKLYPFSWVNNPDQTTAAAAGGCILIKASALANIGGISVIKNALIDDCALAFEVKKIGKIWLGLTDTTYSTREYPSLESIWNMVSRTAFTQLNYSSLLLLGTLLGMVLVYIVSPIGLIWGLISHHLIIIILSLIIWGLMAIAYYPTIRLYGLSGIWSWTLPAIALLYSLMTLDSAFRYFLGQRSAWKGRVYEIE